MKEYDVCLHVGAGEKWLADFYLEIKKELEERGISVLLYTSNCLVKDVFVERKIEDFVYLDLYKGKIDIEWALSFVRDLGFNNTKSLYVSELKFYDISEHDAREFFARLVHSIHALSESPKAKLYITYEGDEFDHNIFRVFTRMMKGKSVYWGYSNLDIRLHFHYDEKRYSKTVVEDVDSIPPCELEWIRNYIYNYTNRKTSLWGDPKKHDIKFRISYLGSFFRKMVEKLRARDIDPRTRLSHSLFVYVRRLLRRQYAYTKYVTKFAINNGDDYYYFPMHVPFDSQLTQRALPFYDQVSLIETICQYIPFPSKLIVKEHPMGRGLYSISDIKRLSKIPNVILLPAYANSHNIVPKVKGIFVINSSVGYEGLMYGKPVVTFGRSFFRKQGLTIDIESLYDLEDISLKIESHQFSQEDVEKFLYRVKKNTYPVDLYNIERSNFKEKSLPFINALETEIRKVLTLPKSVSESEYINL